MEMDRSTTSIFKFEYLVLVTIMMLAFYLVFIPHNNYLYPVHLDEWNNIAFSNEIIKLGGVIGLDDPFSGGAPIYLQKFEVGFHLFWAVFHQISGISWLTIFRYFPGIIFVITVLSVYVLGNRQGFGWQAAFFTSMIPTTVGILGPAFLVAVAMGLPFISLSLFIAFNLRSWWSYTVLFIFATFLISMHAPTAICLVLVLTPHILLNLTSNFRHSLGVTLAVVVPFLLPLPWIIKALLPTIKSLFAQSFLDPYVYVPIVIKTYGYLPVLFCLLGIWQLTIKGGRSNYSLLLGLLALLMMLATFFTFHYGIQIVYYRGLVDMMLMLSIVAGAGLMMIKNLSLPLRLVTRLRIPPIISKNIGNALCIILVGLTLAICIPVRQGIPYYHMIDSEDYQSFVWIKENVGNDYETAILDPWKGTAFTAITGKKVYTKISVNPLPKDEKAYKFLSDGCSDTDFLRQNGISIVYTQSPVHNPYLVEVTKNVYLLSEGEKPE